MGSNDEKKALVTVGSNLPAIETVADLERLGKLFQVSGLFGCSHEGQGAVLVMTCLSEHISPVEFAKTYHIIDGNISMKADAMLAKFVERGGKYKIIERSETRAAALFTKGQNKLEVEFTMEEAVRRNLTVSKKGKEKTSWKDNPKQMLWARLGSDTVRVLDPGVNFGVYTPEEVSDFGNRPVRVIEPEAVETVQEGQKPTSTNDDNPFPSETLASEDPPEIDYTIIPFGKFQGRMWNELTLAQMRGCLTLDRPEITEGHKSVLRELIESHREIAPSNPKKGKENAA